MAAYYNNVPNPTNSIEPEAVGISSDSSFALVTIQDSSSVASLSLDVVALGQQQGLSPQQIGNLALKGVLHLPFGFIGRNGALFGVEPDGVGSQTFHPIVANEANSKLGMAGFSVIDLRNGLRTSPPKPIASSISTDALSQHRPFGRSGCRSGDPYPAAARGSPPGSGGVEINRGGQTVAALVIERYDPRRFKSGLATNETPAPSGPGCGSGPEQDNKIDRVSRACRFPIGSIDSARRPMGLVPSATAVGGHVRPIRTAHATRQWCWPVTAVSANLVSQVANEASDARQLARAWSGLRAVFDGADHR